MAWEKANYNFQRKLKLANAEGMQGFESQVFAKSLSTGYHRGNPDEVTKFKTNASLGTDVNKMNQSEA